MSDHKHLHTPHVHGPNCNHAKEQPFVRATPKVGRNDPCVCGSGKKYKQCCLPKLSQQPQSADI